jgi:Fur family zinc uptake transcriptional regulator
MTDNTLTVLHVLKASKAPMSAYAILDALRGRETGIKAPTQVYRALDRLVKEGEVHRVAALNAFVRCACAHHGQPPGFLVCTRCGAVDEFNASLPATQGKMKLSGANVEISGTCQKCQKVEAE